MTKFFTHIIVHGDEISLKGKNQPFFIRKLKENICRAFGNKVSVQTAGGKLLIPIGNGLEVAEGLKRLNFIPGIANFAAALLVESNLDAIKSAAARVEAYYQPATFKIETVRTDKNFSLRSMEVNRNVGEFILQQRPAAKVDVHHPELTIKVEIEKYQTAVLGQKQEGLGGLPVGTSGKVVVLLSGGLDSPVAAFKMLKRGAEVVLAHFYNQTAEQSGVESKIKRLAERLARYQGKEMTLYIISIADLQKQIIANTPAASRLLLYRRLMLRLAEKVAQTEGAGALVTGDSLGQVASQTLENLAAVYQATIMLKFAPLIGENKIEIVKLAKQIGTYDISIEPHADCCSLLIAKHPETKADLARIIKLEQSLNLDEGIEEAFKNSRILKINWEAT